MSNIFYNGTNIDTIYETPALGALTTNRNYQVNGVDIANRYTALTSVSTANGNIATRIPPTGVLLSNGTDLSSIFAGNPGQYSTSSLATASSSTTRTVTGTSVFTHQFTVTFASASALTNYFLYGGRIVISASNVGSFGGGSADALLQSAFSSIGNFIVYDVGCYRTGAGGTVNNPTVGGSNIGTSTTTLYTLNIGAPYGTSSYVIQMVANAASGSATVLTFTITLTLVRAGVVNDVYNGTRNSIIQQRNYSGAVPPTQSAPTYGLTTFNW